MSDQISASRCQNCLFTRMSRSTPTCIDVTAPFGPLGLPRGNVLGPCEIPNSSGEAAPFDRCGNVPAPGFQKTILELPIDGRIDNRRTRLHNLFPSTSSTLNDQCSWNLSGCMESRMEHATDSSIGLHPISGWMWINGWGS